MLRAAEACKFPAHIANYVTVTRPELKAFIAVNMAKLPSIGLYWSSNDLFRNGGITQIMTKIRFKEISQSYILVILPLSPHVEQQDLIVFTRYMVFLIAFARNVRLIINHLTISQSMKA